MSGWLPTRVHVGLDGVPRVELRHLDDAPLDAPSFDDELSRAAGAERREVSLAELEALPGAADPAGLVLHCSRCGSTLLTRLLGAFPGTTALGEPPALDEALRAGLPRPERLRLVRAVARALCAPTATAPGRRFLKLDCWSTEELPLLREAFPAAPWTFLYREPEHVVASHLRRPGMQVVPGLVLDPAELGLTLDEAVALGPAGYAARVVRHLLVEGLEHLDASGRLAHYDELLTDPGRIAVLAHLGAYAGPAELERLHALTADDAKEPNTPYDPSTRTVGDDARAAAVVAQDAYAALEARRLGTDVPRAPRRARLPLRFDAAALEADVAALGEEAWTPHFNTGHYEGDWSGVALRAAGDGLGGLHPDATADDAAWAPTAALERSPALREAVGRFRCAQRSVRLLRLGPGATVREHTDAGLGHAHGEVRVHVPISTSDGAVFRHDGDEVAMRAGEAWYTDVTLPHAVANRGDGPRVHLVLDLVVDDWVDALLVAGEPE